MVSLLPERQDLVRTHPASLHKNVPGVKFLPYEERLVKLGLWTLKERRNRADLVEVFKLVKGLVNNPFDIFFEKSTNSHLRGHSWKLNKSRCHMDLRKYFFSVRVVDRWNKLPQEAIDSTSVDVFKSRLQRIRDAQMSFFTDVPAFY